MKRFLKYTVFSIIFFAGLFSYAQNNISIDVKDKSILAVLNEIGKQTNYHFVFAHSIIDDDRKITIKSDNEDILNLLNRLFQESEITITVIDEQIILHSANPNNNNNFSKNEGDKKLDKPEPVKNNDSLIVKNRSNTESIIVKGQISDIERKPLSHVQITANSSLIEYSDFNGQFEIVIPDSLNIITFFLYGYETQTIDISKNIYLNVMMLANAENLKEVMVTGYQTISVIKLFLRKGQQVLLQK